MSQTVPTSTTGRRYGLSPWKPDAEAVEYVVATLEQAGRTLLSLPPETAVGYVRVAAWAHMAPGVSVYNDYAVSDRAPRIQPSAQAIDQMDEAFKWLAYIPQDKFVIRRIVAVRSLVCPRSDRHVFSWRRLATVIGADHKAVKRWHGQGIEMIVKARAEKRI